MGEDEDDFGENETMDGFQDEPRVGTKGHTGETEGKNAQTLSDWISQALPTPWPEHPQSQQNQHFNEPEDLS